MNSTSENNLGTELFYFTDSGPDDNSPLQFITLKRLVHYQGLEDEIKNLREVIKALLKNAQDITLDDTTQNKGIKWQLF